MKTPHSHVIMALLYHKLACWLSCTSFAYSFYAGSIYFLQFLFLLGLYRMIDNKKNGSSAKALTVWKDHMVSMGFGYKQGLAYLVRSAA